MEFAWNTQKNKIGDVKGLEKEQEREGKISNNEIDRDKTCLNYDLVQSELNLYQRIKQRVDEVRPVSRVQKNSVVDYSNIITVPQEQFQKWGMEKSKEYLQEVYNYFCQEFGKENVVSAKVHLDETCPHLHLHFVPVSPEGKLQARKVMTPKRINSIHDNAPSYLQEKGFDVVRGTGKTEKSLEIKEFKAKSLQEKIDSLEQQLADLTAEHDKTMAELKEADEKATSRLKSLDKISNELSKYEAHAKETIRKLDNIEAKKSFLSDKLTITEQDYSILISLAKAGEAKMLENLTLKSKVTTLQHKLDSVVEDIEKVKDLQNRHLDLMDRYNKLHRTYKRVEDAINKMDLVDKVNDQMKLMDAARIKNKNFNIER